MAKVKDEKTTKRFFSGIGSWVFFNIPFVLFCAFILIIYIGITIRVERGLHKIEELKKERNEARSKYLGVKRSVMYGSISSQIAKDVEKKDLNRLKKAHGYIKVE